MNFMEAVLAFLNKVKTVLGDRRAWLTGVAYAILALMGMFGLASDTIDQLKDLIDLAYTGVIDLTNAALALATVVAAIITLLAPLLGLIQSWAKRPPSGLNPFMKGDNTYDY